MDPVTMGLIGGGVGALGGLLSTWGADRARQEQAQAMLAAMDQAQPMLEAGYTEAAGYQQPYAQAGQGALGQLSGLLSGFDINQFTPAQQAAFAYDLPEYTVDQFMDPAMQQRIEAGSRALEASAAGRGALKSGATLKGITDYAQQQASQEYGNAWNRMMQMGQQARGDRNFAYQQYADNATRAAQNAQMRLQAFSTQLGGLGNLAGMGASAAGNLGNIAMGRGESMANLAMGRGTANANAVGTPWQGYLGAALGAGGAAFGQYGAGMQDQAQYNDMMQIQRARYGLPTT